MFPNGIRVAVGAVALIGLGLGLGAGAANAAASSAGTPGWRPGPSGVDGSTTAVTGVRASSTTTEFAFVDNGFTHQIYVRVNSKAWTKMKSNPAMATGEIVVAAKAIAANRLVAFTVLGNGSSRVLSYDAGKWTVIGKFGALIGNATVLSASNIWVFGEPGSKGLGVWHYNGKSWKRVATGGSDGSGVTATSAWAVNGTVVEHYSGGKQTSTNLASLIPLGVFGGKSLVGVYANPGSPVYAVGSGNTQDAGGPNVVLELTSHGWKRVASYGHGYIWTTAVSTDGKGGLFLGGVDGAGGPAQLLHYASGSGKLVSESVPGMTNRPDSPFETAANVPGTTVMILGGATPLAGAVTRATIYTSN